MFLLLLACNDVGVNPVPPANGGGIPVALVDPLELVFAPIEVGTHAEQTVTVRNGGQVTLNVADLTITGSTAFDVTAGPTMLAPGESAVWTVSFSPAGPADEGFLHITTDDPVRPLTSVSLAGEALAPELSIWPNPMDFGDVPVGCSLTLPVVLSNVGLAPLVVESVAEDGEGWSAELGFELPLTLAPGEQASVDVTFTPPRGGHGAGALYVQSNDLVPLRVGTQTANGAGDWRMTESFVQGDGPWERTDILLWADTSGSMNDERYNLGVNAALLVDALAYAALDWQLVVASSEDGCATAWFDASTLNAEELVDALDTRGGHLYEAGLTVAREALEQSVRGGCNEGFLRRDSKTTIMLVSDEEEQSEPTVTARVGEIREAAPTATIHAVAGDVPRGCDGAEPGIGYDEAADLTGGAFLSICAPDWGMYFDTIATMAASGQTDTFVLSNWPDPATLEVLVEGVAEARWTYDLDDNAIVFEPEAIPAPAATILVMYEVGAECGG